MKKTGAENKAKGDERYLELLIARGVKPEDLPEDLKGNPVHIPQVNFNVPLEHKVRAKMGPPPYAVRAKYMEDLIRQLETELEKQWRTIAETYRGNPPRFAQVWTAVVETLDLEPLNRLIKEHNTFYPIEANLREHPETGQIMIGATPWKPTPKITAERLLSKFPPDLHLALKCATDP